MTVIPAGTYRMGSEAGDSSERPVHTVLIPHPLAVGTAPVTFQEWDLCHAEGGTTYSPPEQPRNPKVADGIWERGQRPVINVDWNDAREYCRWLAGKTGKDYRLPSEAEWEYFARGGTTSEYCFGNDIAGKGLVLCRDGIFPVPSNTRDVRSFPPNSFGIYDVHGNVWEWVEDSRNNDTYENAPKDGTAWVHEQQAFRMLRGGSWHDGVRDVRSSTRKWSTNGFRFDGGTLGFRVVRNLTPDEMAVSLPALQRPLSSADVSGCTQLGSLQAGILSALRGRHYVIATVYGSGSAKLKDFIGHFSRHLSSAAEGQRLRFMDTGEFSSAVQMTMHLAHSALVKLGEGTSGFEEAYVKGMADSAFALNDPHPVTFQEPYDCHEPDILLILAGDNLQKLDERITEIRQVAADCGTDVLRIDTGQTRKDERGVAIGPLGFADGISQPNFFSASPDHGQNRQVWNPAAHPGLAIVDDPLHPGGLGSYLVYRKYSIDESVFERQVMTVYGKLNRTRSEDEIRALFFGRHRDGSPLAKYPGPVRNADHNDFSYADDPDGLRCPFHSHIRKMNPRGEHLGATEKNRRIVRRGYTIGGSSHVDRGEAGHAGTENGLHFLCYQASIRNQFEFLQAVWADDDTFQYGHFPGVDAVVGRAASTEQDDDYQIDQQRIMKWPKGWATDRDQTVAWNTESFVRLLGGGYFFTPSISFLRTITGTYTGPV